jgi:heat shock protein HslJ
MNKKTLLPLIALLVIFGATYFVLTNKNTQSQISADPQTDEQAVTLVKKAYPFYEDYPSDNLPPKSIEVEKTSEGWRVGMYMEGSGLQGILKANCFLVASSGAVIETGIFQGEGPAKRINLATCTPVVAENPEGEADPSRMTLQMQTWTWINALYNDGRVITPKQPQAFKITFKNDGTFSASTDCNSVGGEYNAKNGIISFDGSIAMTMMYCEGSQDSEFAQLLQNINGYHFTNRGELIFDLKFDSGTVTFR